MQTLACTCTLKFKKCTSEKTPLQSRPPTLLKLKTDRTTAVACTQLNVLTYKHGSIASNFRPGTFEESYAAHHVEIHLVREVLDLETKFSNKMRDLVNGGLQNNNLKSFLHLEQVKI